MRRHHITLGAMTTAGGQVVSASSNGSIDDKPIALEGDKIMCRSCQSVGYIICIGPRIPELWGDGHKQVALEGDLCVCKCVPHPRLLPNQSLRYQEVDGDGMPASMNGSPAAAAAQVAPQPAESEEGPHALRFQAIDPETGEPLPYRPYVLTRGDGSTFSGTTDENGYTDPTQADEAEQVDVHVTFLAPSKTLDREEVA